MLRTLGFGFISSEIVTWVIGAMALVAMAAAWVADAILDEAAFGVMGNFAILLGGALAGIVAWNRWYASVESTDPVVLVGVTVASGFSLLLVLAFGRRFLNI